MEKKPMDTKELAEMIAGLPVLPEVERHRTARRLVDEAKRILSMEADALIERATKKKSYKEVAEEFGTSVDVVNKAVSRHRRRVGASDPMS